MLPGSQETDKDGTEGSQGCEDISFFRGMATAELWSSFGSQLSFKEFLLRMSSVDLDNTMYACMQILRLFLCQGKTTPL